jgi:type II secretory pathway pseudopilin PulG
MLVVLAILGIVLAGLTALFEGASRAQSDQTYRGQAQQDARLALDKLRREIHCASTISTPSGWPASSVTITLGSWCTGAAAGTTTTVTWCTKDKNGTTPPAAGAQPYTLWRYVAGSCSGTGTKWASNLVDTPFVTAGKIFNSANAAAPALVPAATGGSLPLGTYSYEVTALLAGGAEVPGAVASTTVTAGTTNQITVSWSAYPGAVSYNVYGNNANSVRLLKNTTGTSYVDTGPTALSDNPFTLPSTGTFNVNVAGTANFNSTANTIQFGASGPVTCTGTTSAPSASFTGCTGGQPGQYATGTPVYSASSARPPLATVSVSLPVDETPADAKQRFLLSDDIALRNSR